MEQRWRVALVHDYLTEMGGAESVVESLLSIFPDAPLYTSVYNRRVTSAAFAERDVRTSFMQRLTQRKAVTKALFPLFPPAFRRFDFGGYDVVLSSASGFAHHVRPPRETLHICYCHNPPRFLWQPREYFRTNELINRIGYPMLAALRRLDRRAAGRVDAYLANSAAVAGRIERIYGRPAEVLHPPVRTSRFRIAPERSERFLVVSRLVAHKRIDLAVEAATRLGLPLDVIGDGPDRKRLERIGGEHVRFLGRQPDAVVESAMARATAVIVAGVEDFGITAIEAQASGRPPIGFADGGSLETIEDGRTGFLFPDQSWQSVAAAMKRAQTQDLDPRRLRASAQRFDISVFERRLKDYIARQLEVKGLVTRRVRPTVTRSLASGRA